MPSSGQRKLLTLPSTTRMMVIPRRPSSARMREPVSADGAGPGARRCHVRRLPAGRGPGLPLGSGAAPAPRRRVQASARTIATTTDVDLEACSSSSRPRHHMVLMTTRADGRPQASPVTGGVDAAGPHRHLDLPGAGQDGQRPPRPAGQRARAVRRLRRRVGAGRRRVRGHRPARLRRAARGVLPLHLRRAPRLGRVPPGDGRAGQVAAAHHPDPLGTGRHRRLPGASRRPDA